MPDTYDSEIPMERIVLERFQIAARVMLSEELAEPPQLEMMRDHILGHLVVVIKQSIMAQPPRTFEIKHPADWFQAFRERWFPKWWLRRHPVQYTVHKMTATVLYPSIAMPDRDPRFYFERFDYTPVTWPESSEG